MTCIAVRINKKQIEIAGDTQTTWGWNKLSKIENNDSSLKSTGKIFQVNGMTLGCAGSVAHIGLPQIFCKTSKPKEMERDAILDWLIAFKEFALAKAKINFNDISIHGIIATKGKVFSFYDFMDVKPVADFFSVGSGMFLALGAMDTGATASQAVKVAIKYDLFCGGQVKKIIIK